MIRYRMHGTRVSHRLRCLTVPHLHSLLSRHFVHDQMQLPRGAAPVHRELTEGRNPTDSVTHASIWLRYSAVALGNVCSCREQKPQLTMA